MAGGPGSMIKVFYDEFNSQFVDIEIDEEGMFVSENCGRSEVSVGLLSLDPQQTRGLYEALKTYHEEVLS